MAVYNEWGPWPYPNGHPVSIPTMPPWVEYPRDGWTETPRRPAREEFDIIRNELKEIKRRLKRLEDDAYTTDRPNRTIADAAALIRKLTDSFDVDPSDVLDDSSD